MHAHTYIYHACDGLLPSSYACLMQKSCSMHQKDARILHCKEHASQVNCILMMYYSCMCSARLHSSQDGHFQSDHLWRWTSNKHHHTNHAHAGNQDMRRPAAALGTKLLAAKTWLWHCCSLISTWGSKHKQGNFSYLMLISVTECCCVTAGGLTLEVKHWVLYGCNEYILSMMDTKVQLVGQLNCSTHSALVINHRRLSQQSSLKHAAPGNLINLSH